MLESGLNSKTDGESNFTAIRSFNTPWPRRDLLQVFNSLSCEKAVSHLTLVGGSVNIRSTSTAMFFMSDSCRTLFQQTVLMSLPYLQ